MLTWHLFLFFRPRNQIHSPMHVSQILYCWGASPRHLVLKCLTFGAQLLLHVFNNISHLKLLLPVTTGQLRHSSSYLPSCCLYKGDSNVRFECRVITSDHSTTSWNECLEPEQMAWHGPMKAPGGNLLAEQQWCCPHHFSPSNSVFLSQILMRLGMDLTSPWGLPCPGSLDS